MMWMDYTINQAGPHFKVMGDWEGEVMGIAQDGTKKDHYLYRPGDVFIVDENGWLCKTDNLTKMILATENNKS